MTVASYSERREVGGREMRRGSIVGGVEDDGCWSGGRRKGLGGRGESDREREHMREEGTSVRDERKEDATTWERR